MLHAEYFQKTLHFLQNRQFYLFWGGFVWGLYGGFDWKMPIFCPRSQFLTGSSHAAAIFSDQLLFAFWTAGFTARPPDRVSTWCTPVFPVSNRTIGCILKRSAGLYGDSMEPDHMAKYSLPMLTDLTENLIQKNQLSMCWPPYSSEGVFGRVSAFCVHPCGLFLKKSILTKP
jgi:hypothetical protein